MEEITFGKIEDEEDFCDIGAVILEIFPEALLEFDENNSYFFAKKGKQIIGFAHAMRAKKGEYILQGLGVLPEFRGKGIGNKLADLAIEFCEGMGAGQIVLKVKMTNPAILLYLKKGFFLKKVLDVFVLERRRNS
ncbi:hypothetical protein AUJ17_02935 [Candidatus Micrarchaeota archaeon CG1_02_47_40]|nr:MAG: hypothetical protein AUJ17_02935 [Candidatus Micrarchaeota archaeon CG1_02_47_40]